MGSFRDDETAHALDSWERVAGREGQMDYAVRREDDGYFVRAQFVPVVKNKKQSRKGITGSHGPILSSVVGPCEEAGPMIDTIRVEGDPVVGGCLVAVVDYWGGDEGPSEYQWMRVKDGVRQKGDKVKLDPSKNMGLDPFDPMATEAGLARGDPRFRRVVEDDIGSKFKVTCLPARRDGLTGEPKTSRPSKKVT